MKKNLRPLRDKMGLLWFLLSVLVLSALVLFPQIDVIVSGFFYEPGVGFFLKDNAVLLGFKYTAFYGARILAVCFVVAALVSFFGKMKFISLNAKSWVFLLCCLLIGPGLIANVVFKEHWGRARPRDVELFGGTKSFSPAGYMTDQCERNCSFVSGDASFGFFLTVFAFVGPYRRQKLIFWSCFGVGSFFAGARVLLGAHFLSDVLFALVFIMAVNFCLATLFYGKKSVSKTLGKIAI